MSMEPEATPAVTTDADEAEVPGTAGTRLDRLEEEGDIAADYLEELLDIADIDGDIDIEVRGGRTYISVVSDDQGNAGLQGLVGGNGEVLEALQELTRLSVLSSTASRSRLVLDIDGYRARRGAELKRITDEAVAKVRASGDSVALESMSAYERKIVHDAVAAEGLGSESEGEGGSRHVVVFLPES